MDKIALLNGKKLLFLINDPVFCGNGVSNKIQSQLDALSKLCAEVYYSYLSEDGSQRIILNHFFRTNKFIRLIPYLQRYYFKDLMNFIIAKEIDVLYIRYTHFASPGFNSFLKKLSQFKVSIILEFPTFPYDDEYQTLPLKSKVKLRIDKFFRSSLKKYVNNAVTFTDDAEIFGIPTIKISNALSKSRIEYAYNHIQNSHKKELSQIKLVGVASMEKWHGYDRLLTGLARYVSRPDAKSVHLDLIGDGRELRILKDIANNLNINDFVTFHGHLEGERLNALLLNADIGIDSLARHRAGNNKNNSLKSKEYLAFGLPIVKSHLDPSIDDSEFYINVPANESSINLNEIIGWFTDQQFSEKKLVISSYAKANFSWDSQMIKILRSSLS
ncbi:glycosyltransferase [Enterobacter kobei]|uniref:glycosyltransferase n=1 Tax=Enterobacter kobei TaxID=208224 RepID=UPI001F521AA5|nr:glycosyltransferase [Enterobacter kobei]EMC7915980.1 glycosyltransferase [Enterobacter kobei]MCH4291968.1 glycosyltransferase [Enterobacter kobei]